jgi:ADP-heptose:LPS heptosyltransferase
MYLTDEEKALGRIESRQIVVQCVGDGSYGNVMRNKLYPKERFQTVIELIKRELRTEGLKIIQLGGKGDPLLDDVTDLRGKTTLRQTAGIISQSDALIGTSGFLAHLARAVDCRSVIIYGGREHSYQSGYTCNENIDSYVECAPCWRWNGCEFNRKCMTMIEPNQVFDRLLEVLEKRDTSVETDLVTI